jgi:hypothetical protein
VPDKRAILEAVDFCVARGYWPGGDADPVRP